MCTRNDFEQLISRLVFFFSIDHPDQRILDSDWTQNGQPPQILGAIGHPRYNGIRELTDFVITELHCTTTVQKERNF